MSLSVNTQYSATVTFDGNVWYAVFSTFGSVDIPQALASATGATADAALHALANIVATL